jgi:hypothetical protein
MLGNGLDNAELIEYIINVVKLERGKDITH